MKSKRYIIALAASAVVIIGVSAAVVLREREPRYQGTTLTKWVELGSKAKDRIFKESGGFDERPRRLESDPDWQAASQAVNAMAPAAIPILLRWNCAKDVGRIVKAKEALNDLLGWHLNTEPGLWLNIKSQIGFQLLGSEAKPAWPTLIQRTSSTDPRMRASAAFCLYVTWLPDETLRPILLRLKRDPDTATAEEAKVLEDDAYDRTKAASVGTNAPRSKGSGTNATP